MAGKIKIKCPKGTLRDSEITTESGEVIYCSDFKVEIRNRQLFAIIPVPQPILDIDTENCEVIYESRNDSM